MGRSVSYPNDSHVVFCDTSEIEDQLEFEDFLDHVQVHTIDRYPSFIECDKWVGQEDHAILENDHAYVGVSEYCGLSAVWLLPKACVEDMNPSDTQLGVHWCDQVSGKLLEPWDEFRKQGTMSNGVAVFQRTNPDQDKVQCPDCQTTHIVSPVSEWVECPNCGKVSNINE